MTTRQTAPPVYAQDKYAPEDQFPERPPRYDMQNSLYRERPGHMTALARHFGSPDTILVLGEIPVRHTFQRGLEPQMLRYPDLIVAFGADSAEVIARHGYAIDDQGKPPDFVLEIASPWTALNDYTTKRVDYAGYGIPEYWRFDPTDGDRYPAGLAGDRLVDGEYQPIDILGTRGRRVLGPQRRIEPGPVLGERPTAVLRSGGATIPPHTRRRGRGAHRRRGPSATPSDRPAWSLRPRPPRPRPGYASWKRNWAATPDSSGAARCRRA